MGVETLDSDTRSCNSTRRMRTRPRRIDVRITQAGVAPMGGFDFSIGNFILCATHASGGFEATDAPIRVRITQPVQRWHRCAVEQKRSITDHHGTTALVAYDDDEFSARFTSEKVGDDRDVVFALLVFGQ